MKKEVLGIDISKNTIDTCLHNKQVYHQFDNTTKGYKELCKWVKGQTGLSLGHVLICFEHTGLYSMPLAVFLTEKQFDFCMVSGLEIKRSLGISRGKNDKVDAQRIAEYAYLRREKLPYFELPSKAILKLQKLVNLRERLVKQRAGYSASIKEMKAVLKQKEHPDLFAVQNRMIRYLTKQIQLIENEMKKLIEEDHQLCRIYQLVTSVKGVGLIVASHLIVTTNCFKAFTDSRKFACYAGIAPFEKQSGTSLKAKSTVSHLANKTIKTLLNLAASSAIQADPELKAYYQKRIAKGKSRMSTLNIVRNKIVHRVFAVVKRGTPYVPLYQHVA